MPERPGSLPLAELVAEQRARLSLSLAAVARGMAEAAIKEGSYCGASRQTIHQIEQGRIPHPDSLRWLAVALNLPASKVVKAARHQRVNRRRFLRNAAVMGGALGGGVLDERLSYALDGRGRLDAETVSDMAAITAGYRRAYRQLSVRVLRPQVHGHRAILTELLGLGCSGSPVLRDRLVATLGEAEALLGCMLVLDLGNFDRGSFHLARALQAARHADARELEAFILGGMTFYAAYGGNQAEALQLVARARQLAGTTGMPATRGWLAAVDAEMQARAGNANSAQRALDDAATALQDVHDHSPPTWIGIGTFNTAKLASYSGLCSMLLGRPHRAVEELTQALEALDPALRKHRCTAMADLATALIQLKEIDEGCRQASTSLQLAIELRHAANADRIRQLRPRLDPWSGHPAVRRLDEQLRAVARW
jgi:transcriptional regulator with XRE-family HTH domain